jgi:hypothetical protein
MKITVSLMSGANNTERQVLRAFYQGIISHYRQKHAVETLAELKEKFNIDLHLSYDQEIGPCDIGVQFGTLKDRSADHHVTKQSVAENSQNIIYIETPLLSRTIDEKNNYNYYRVGVNGYLHNQGTFYLDSQLDPQRLERLIDDKLIQPFPGWHTTSYKSVLILCQLPGDSSLRGQRMSEWLLDTVESIRAQSDRKIAVRLHPAMSAKGRSEFYGEIGGILFRNYKNITWRTGLTTTLKQDLDSADVCVAYSSGSSVDAILAGVPVIAMDEGNFAWPISSNTLADLNNPRLASDEEISAWMMSLANSQWTSQEMHSGQVWTHVEEIFEKLYQR